MLYELGIILPHYSSQESSSLDIEEQTTIKLHDHTLKQVMNRLHIW